MNKIFPAAAACALMLTALGAGAQSTAKAVPAFDTREVLRVLRTVCDWQLAHQPDSTIMHDAVVPITNTDWFRAAFFIGVMATYHATNDVKYLDAAIALGEKNHWKLGPRRHPDDQSIAQVYADIYEIKKDPKMIAHAIETFSQMMATPKPGREEWLMCDYMFTAPNALARTAKATGDQRYLDYMNKMWWDNHDMLYQKDIHLYLRDYRYLKSAEGSEGSDGKAIEYRGRQFLSRPNAWVMAGIARLLEVLPKDYPSRGEYVRVFKEMAASIITLQQPSGFWRHDLLDPDKYPVPETSGTGFYTFALAYGVNHGILAKETYLPHIRKSWHALQSATSVNGRIGWVLRAGNEPSHLHWDDTMEFATGAFLLAGSEILNITK